MLCRYNALNEIESSTEILLVFCFRTLYSRQRPVQTVDRRKRQKAAVRPRRGPVVGLLVQIDRQRVGLITG